VAESRAGGADLVKSSDVRLDGERIVIIENQRGVTAAVLAELQRASDPRFKEIMSAAVTHLHGFVRDAKLTEAEFHQACSVIARLGQLTTASHNEVVLIAGSLGLSALVCLLNNGDDGQTETTANLMGPFWRMDSPLTESGGSIVRSPTAGDPVFVTAWVRDRAGRPVADAEVDVWHASSEGFYENQDPAQADMNLRGKLTTDADGRFWFRSVKPAGYPVSTDGPVGDLLRAQRRHPYRPAHLHFLGFKEGYKTLITQVFVDDDEHLESDVVFGVTRHLVGDYRQVGEGEYRLDYEFVMEPGEAKLPKPPIK
jgi:hydroxyquinol 1,2-dioxygenase